METILLISIAVAAGLLLAFRLNASYRASPSSGLAPSEEPAMSKPAKPAVEPAVEPQVVASPADDTQPDAPGTGENAPA